MKREEKYPDTKYFHYYNANSHNHKSGDCVIRAICTVLNESWEETLKGLFEVGVKYGYTPTDDHAVDKYLKSKGYVKCKEPRDEFNRKYRVCEYLEEKRFVPNMIANVGSHHMVAIKDSKVNDIWNSSRETLHTYYVKGLG